MTLDMSQAGSASFDDVVHAWLEAELGSSRWSPAYRRIGCTVMPQSLALRLRAPAGVRRPLLAGLPLDAIEWVRVPIALSVLSASYYLSIPAGPPMEWWRITSGTNVIGIGAQRFRSDDEVRERVEAAIRAIEQGVALAPIIMLAERVEGHLVVMEGCARATAYVALERAPGLALVGLSERMREWPWWTEAVATYDST